MSDCGCKGDKHVHQDLTNPGSFSLSGNEMVVYDGQRNNDIMIDEPYAYRPVFTGGADLTRTRIHVPSGLRLLNRPDGIHVVPDGTQVAGACPSVKSSLICDDTAAFACAGTKLVPSVFFVKGGKAIPLAGEEPTLPFADGDFKTVGPLSRMRSLVDTWAAYDPKADISGLVNASAASGGALPFHLVLGTASIDIMGGAPIAGFSIQLATLSITKPSFTLSINTVGLSTKNRSVSVNRSFTIKVASWMYDDGELIVPLGYRRRNEGGLFMPAGTYADPSTITLTVPTAYVSSFLPTLTVLQPDSDAINAVLASLNHTMAGR